VSLVIVELRAAKASKREQKAVGYFTRKHQPIISGRPKRQRSGYCEITRFKPISLKPPVQLTTLF